MPPTTHSFSTPLYPWSPDARDGTYLNPVLCADYSDPDVCRVGPDFFLTASSFNCTPGLPILHSRDLVNWTLINHAIKSVPGDRYNVPRHGEGVWAPAIRFHDNRFWIFFPTPDEGVYVTTAADPRGKWSEPRMLLPGKGIIDPCPLWDDDGRAYLVHAYAKSRAGIKDRLRVRPMSSDAARILGEGEIVFSDPVRHPTLEGPKFLKKDGFYYLSAPAGGVPTGWQLVLRSKSPFGPYEPKIVLAQGPTPVNGPHQGALVDAPDGRWWFLHFQERLPFGRIVHLQPVTWQDNWPLIGGKPDAPVTTKTLAPGLENVAAFTPGELDDVRIPVSSCDKPVQGQPFATPATSDDFASATLGLQWQWHANADPAWHSLTARPNHLRLYAAAVPDADLSRAGNLLLQKLPAMRFAVETAVELSPDFPSPARAGLIVMGLEHAALYLQPDGQDVALYLSINNHPQLLTHVPTHTHDLRAVMTPDGITTFSHRAAPNSPWLPIPTPFKAREGRWIGAKIGLFCLTPAPISPTPHADARSFRFTPTS